jgi:hypothetical protein
MHAHAADGVKSLAEMKEDVCVDDDCAEFDSEDPNVMEPEAVEIVLRINPAL